MSDQLGQRRAGVGSRLEVAADARRSACPRAHGDCTRSGSARRKRQHRAVVVLPPDHPVLDRGGLAEVRSLAW
jgi:hypothetical protein